MSHLADTTVLVLGLGDSGLAMARWCARSGAKVRVWDSRAPAPQDAALAAHVPSAERLHGELDAAAVDAALDGVGRVLKSPGLAPHDARIAGVLRRAAECGVPVQGELELFAAALAGLKAGRGYAPKLVAITGTNGKTTTTALTALLVERAGLTVAVAGNIGPTLLQTLADALDRSASEQAAAPRPHPSPLPGGEGGRIEAAEAVARKGLLPLPLGEGGGEGRGPLHRHLPDAWVLELSSFQLDGVSDAFAPDAAALLNLTEDHLDWHGDMAAYGAAKARVFGGRGVVVANRDDARVEALIPMPPPAPTGGKSRRARAGRDLQRRVVRFGLDAPQRPGDFGLVVEHGMAWLVRASLAEPGAGRRGAVDADPALPLQRLMPADALRIRGRHNAANALAALALGTAIGCPLAPMLHGLREYAGEPHRVQFVATVGGVDAYDDSKGTNVGATVAALLGLGADKAPAKLVVILGGDGKGQDFAPLAEPVARHARAVATLGRDAVRIEAALEAAGVDTERHATLDAATRWCFGRAQAGDAVLLSPACASLDMFRDYAHRAQVFVDTVRALAAERGEVAA